MKPLVLIVEDDPEIRLVLADILETCGYAVSQAQHGREALDKLEAGLRPAAILLDLMMPVMNGWVFRAAQLEDRRLASIPIVVLTAMGRAEETGRELRAHAALSKPFEISDLLAILERLAPLDPERASA
ncbi:MAG TPA: response regulator [Anaeromyxobacteraceae bacterium]|nr:response regulator [Anaeromyxobacteraceae bacterium]